MSSETKTNPALDWYLLRAATRQERRACEALKELKIAHYMPIEIVKREINRREVVIERPLFPGYLFAQIADRDFHAATHASAVHAPVRRTLPSGERAPCVIPAALVAALRASEAAGEFDRTIEPPPREMETGDQMRVLAGAFEGLIGTLIETRRGDRIALLIKSRMVELDLIEVEFAA